MAQPTDLACQVLKLEQQLEAYQKLHAEELSELWRILKECKRTLAGLADGAAGPRVASQASASPHDEVA